MTQKSLNTSMEISKKYNSDEMLSIQSEIEWTVIISRFESFNKFYVQQIEDKSSAMKSNSLLSFNTDRSKYLTQQLCVGSIIETLTDKYDGVWYKAEVMAFIDIGIIVRVLDDGSICKSTHMKNFPVNYRCYINEDSIDDGMTNDPHSLNIISNIMMSHEWTMKTSSDREPYKVTLSINGEDCFNFIFKLLTPPAVVENAENSNLSLSVDDGVAEDKDALVIIEEKSNHGSAKTNVDTKNDLVEPHSETVTVKSFITLKNFLVKSESLYTLYMKRIVAELKTCKPIKRKFKNTVGSIMVAIDSSLKRRVRVLVESISSNDTHCYLLDFGDYGVFKKFCKPTEFLRTCPPIVRRCSLYAPNLAGKEDEIWFADVDDVFKDLLLIESVKFDMVIMEKGSWQDPCVVKLMLNNVDISETLFPINVQVTHINSLTDFKIQAISNEQKSVTVLLDSEHVPKVVVKNPIPGNLYLAKFKSQFKRVKFEYFGGVKYVVIDVENTFDRLSVGKLYEIPKSISDDPVCTMACSLILNNTDYEDPFYLEAFKFLADEKVVFIMNIIIENDGIKPNFVKLYHDDKNVFDILNLMKLDK